MGGGVPRGGPPNQTAYYVALASILLLLALLCCYFCYFFISRVKELTRAESALPAPAAPYPVQPGVREGATALAALCRLPAAGAVHPAPDKPRAAP